MVRCRRRPAVVSTATADVPVPARCVARSVRIAVWEPITARHVVPRQRSRHGLQAATDGEANGTDTNPCRLDLRPPTTLIRPEIDRVTGRDLGIGTPVHGRRTHRPPRDSSNGAALGLPTLPGALLISEAGYGHLDIGHPGDLCWRIPCEDTGPIRQALSAALTGCGAPDLGVWPHSLSMPKLPPHTIVAEGENGTLSIGAPVDQRYHLSTEAADPVRRAIAAALAARAAQPRPHHGRHTP